MGYFFNHCHWEFSWSDLGPSKLFLASLQTVCVFKDHLSFQHFVKICTYFRNFRKFQNFKRLKGILSHRCITLLLIRKIENNPWVWLGLMRHSNWNRWKNNILQLCDKYNPAGMRCLWDVSNRSPLRETSQRPLRNISKETSFLRRL